jgi:hypothetical protein
MKVTDAKATILLGLTDIFPGAKGNGTGGIVVLDSCPPKFANDSVNFLNKGFQKKNRGHIVNRNGDKDRFDVSDPACMVKLIGLDSSKLGSEFVNDESISFIPVSVVEYH